MMMHKQQGNSGAPLSAFIAYAREDEQFREQLEKHLRLLRRQGLLSLWNDREIIPGSEWEKEIDKHLETASIILLLISSDFLDSDYCYDKEMQRALERHQHGEARVIPIILRPCEWQKAPFAYLQVLPRDGKSVTEWDNLDAAFLDITREIRRAIERQTSSVRLFPVDRQNRLRLLKRVRETWVKGVLEQSLHQAALLELNLKEQPDALDNPWHLEAQETNRPPRPLPAGTTIVQIYDQADCELLILGMPGSGKTTLLLELVRNLLDRAERDEQHPMPVVFNLSSWAQARQPLTKWIVEELWTKYQVSRKIGQNWVDTHQILPLLDGLDEVAKDVRSICVQMINAYRQHCLEEKGAAPLVTCCRSQEYMAQLTRITLRQAVSIQPLTDEQIERYLQSATGQLEGLRHALCHDPELYRLAQYPLMLNIFTLAYKGAVPEDFPTEGTGEEKQRQVFATYVERMLNRRGVSKRFSNKHMLQWLAFVAARMRQDHQTVLYLEGCQPVWLTDLRVRTLYQLSNWLLFSLLLGLPAGLLLSLFLGLPVGLLLGLPIGLGGWLIGGMGARYLDGGQIKPIEVLMWSWKTVRITTAYWLFFDLLIGLAFGVYFGRYHGLLSGFVFGLAFGLSFVFFFGFSRNQLDEHLRLAPNQGIWRSAQNGLAVGLSWGLFFGLAGVFFFGLPIGLIFGLGFWVLYGLNHGLDAFLKHFNLRLWLWCLGSLPWHLVAFLDEATERLLLRRVGGGYIFIHRLLLDYFASLETSSSEKASTALASLQKPGSYSAGSSMEPGRFPMQGVSPRIPASRRRRQHRRKEI